MAKKRISIRPRGAALAGGSLALVVSGFVFVDGFMIVLGLSGLLLLIAAWVIGVMNLREVSVDLYGPTSVSAMKQFDLKITLQNNRAFLDAFHTDIQLRLFDDSTAVETVASWLASGSSAQIITPVAIRKRGYADEHSFQLTSTFPLGIFKFVRKLTVDYSITVTPRSIVPLELNTDGSMYDANPRSGGAAGHNFGEPRGIRPWQAGDSAKHIHWSASARSLARGHSLRVREYDPPGFHPDQCHIVFHSYATGREILRGDRFERALSLLVGSLTELHGKGIPCILTADFNHWESVPCTTRAHLAECLFQLAKVSRARGSEMHDLQTAIREVSRDHALMVISDMAPESWQDLLVGHPQPLIVDIRQIKYRNQILHAASA